MECLEDFIPTSTYSYVTASSSSYGEPSSTVAATTSDILSDFHEAKLVHPKPANPDVPNQPLVPNTPNFESSVQDDINQIQDLGSSTENLLHEEKQQLSALSNVEAGVLSACGVLVVAGIAVGIFVWKNTTRRRNLRRNHDMPMHDLESNGEGGEDGALTAKERLGALGGKDIVDVSLSQLQSGSGLKAVVTIPDTARGREDFFTNWQRRNQQGNDNFEFEPKQKLIEQQIIPDKTNTVFDLTQQVLSPEKEEAIISEDDVVDALQQTAIPNLEQPNESNDLKIFSKLDDAAAEITQVEESGQLGEPAAAQLSTKSPNTQTNTTTAIPSALDPTYDPTALTYPLQKFLRTPASAFSPMQISVNISSEDDDEDDDDENDDDSVAAYNQGKKGAEYAAATRTQPQPTPNIGKERLPQSPEIIADNKGLLGTPLSQHLNKLLRHPSIERQRMVSTGSSSKMVEISLQDEVVLEPPLQQQFLASPRLNNILGKFTKEPLPIVSNQHHTSHERQLDISDNEKGPAQLFLEDYKKKYLEEHGKPFMSPLDLPDDQYVPLRDAAGPPLISRAKVLADPVRRLGEDEIALWEQSCRKKERKGLPPDMWDENVLRDGVEAYDRNRIAKYYCVAEPPPPLPLAKEEEEVTVPTLPRVQGNNRDQQQPLS